MLLPDVSSHGKHLRYGNGPLAAPTTSRVCRKAFVVIRWPDWRNVARRSFFFLRVRRKPLALGRALDRGFRQHDLMARSARTGFCVRGTSTWRGAQQKDYRSSSRPQVRLRGDIGVRFDRIARVLIRLLEVAALPPDVWALASDGNDVPECEDRAGTGRAVDAHEWGGP